MAEDRKLSLEMTTKSFGRSVRSTPFPVTLTKKIHPVHSTTAHHVCYSYTHSASASFEEKGRTPQQMNYPLKTSTQSRKTI